MDISSQLKRANIEALTTAEIASAVSVSTVGRIVYDSDTLELKIFNGTGFDVMPDETAVNALFASISETTIKNLAYAIGEVKSTFDTESNFLSDYDNKWLLLDGYGQYAGDGEPYLVSAYPLLAAKFPLWVLNIDLGYGGAKDYIFIPDGRSSSLIGEDSRAAQQIVRAAAIGGLIKNSKWLQSTHNALLGAVTTPQIPALTASIDTSTGGSAAISNAAISAASEQGLNLPASSSTTQYLDVVPQAMSVNYFIKALF